MGRKKLSRREFLRLVGVAGATAGTATALGGVVLQVPGAAAGASKSSAQRPTPRLVPTVCGMCTVGCGLLAYVDGERVLKVEGNYQHSHSLGHICPRGSASIKLLYDPDRLKSPLKKQVDGRFAPISWGQAFKEIGERLAKLKQESGAQSLAWAYGATLSKAWDQQFMRAFGSPNVFTTESVGHSSRTAACRCTVGGIPIPDLRRSRYTMIFGRNYAESMFVADYEALAEAKEKGARIVVVDPRLSNTAAQAHDWVPIRPGTDLAMLLAMMHVIVKEKLYNAKFVADHVQGFEELEKYLADKTPWWAASITDVSGDKIRQLARNLASHQPSCLVDIGWHGAWGVLYGNSFQTTRAALALNALLGNYGQPGGLHMRANSRRLGEFKLPDVASPTAERVDGAGGAQRPFVDSRAGIVQLLPEAITSGSPYPIKALVVNHFNPARSLPNTKKVIEALKKLDLLVVIDVQMSETAELAHYVLPESTFLERYDPLAVSERFVPEVALRQPVVQPLHDTKSAPEIIKGLAEACNLGSSFAFQVDDVITATIAPAGLNRTALSRQGVWRDASASSDAVLAFATPSGKIEVYSEALKAAGHDPLPSYQPPLVAPDTRSFRLLHGRVAAHTGTSTQNNAYLHALAADNELWINTGRAAQLGIGNGDWVIVQSEVGELKVRARLTQGIHPEAVFLAHGFGHEARAQRLSFGKGANDNALIVDRVDPISGSACLAETVVRVKRVV